ncbi:MAG: S8 family serine peptidase [Myxococcota bacterium]
MKSEVQTEHDRPHARSYVLELASGQTCPSPPEGWTREPSLTTGSALVDELLGRYCHYRVAPGENPPSPLTTSMLSDPPGARLVADYARVVPQTFPTGGGQTVQEATHLEQRRPDDLELNRELSKQLAKRHQIFLAQQGAKLDLEASSEQTHPFVAIIDTADPGGAMSLGRHAREHHGLAMAGIVDALRCGEDDARCRARSVFSQAFPYAWSNADANEHALGTVWSLTHAVLDAVEQWQVATRDLGRSRPPLVLNMSVGFDWDPADREQLVQFRDMLFHGEPIELLNTPDLTPAEKALLTALSWASCEGALSIAAAGNTQTHRCDEQGPLAPGAWEVIAAPTRQQCQDVFGVPLEPGAGGSHADRGSLVYAAGGVNMNDHAIVNARPGSTPPRVLYASMTPGKVGGGYTSPLTGTSVAAASLSAIAAQVWSLDPSLGPHEVMDEIDGGPSPSHSRPSLGSADVYLEPAQVHRVRAYEIVPRLYAQPSSPISDLRWTLPGFVVTAGSGPSATVSSSNACGGRQVTQLTLAGVQAVSPANVWPELRPQPDHPICATCPLDQSAATLSIKLEPLDSSDKISPQATLVIHKALAGGSRSETKIPFQLTPLCSNPSSCAARDNWRYQVDLSSYELPSDQPPSGVSMKDFLSDPDIVMAELELTVTTERTIGSSTITSTQIVAGEIDIQP